MRFLSFVMAVADSMLAVVFVLAVTLVFVLAIAVVFILAVDSDRCRCSRGFR